VKLNTLLLLVFLSATAHAADHSNLDVGLAQHAFDHLGNLGDQAPAAVASGVNVIYATGLGSLGYTGLPTEGEISKAEREVSTYVTEAKRSGVKLAIGYVCATSIVKIDMFDHNWTPEFRSQFVTPPSEWLQQDVHGNPLPSWYGGDYRPACMNNPDWRKYEKEIVRRQIDAGIDGIFFDNPTVHPQGCYCPHCMQQFGEFLKVTGKDTAAMRQIAISQPKDFLRFRCTVARDFLSDIRTYARTINPNALITCNGSLNSSDVLFAQCRSMGYNLFEMSKAEDFVVVEDMSSQPRTMSDGRVMEYGPVYEMVKSVAHGKPVVAVTIAEGDYHTPPNLVRLAMAEAAAHGASYMLWPTWPADVRERMIDSTRLEADVLRNNSELLNDVQPRADVVVLLPFEKWVETDNCRAMEIARALGAANVQFEVACPEDLASKLKPSTILVAESFAVVPEKFKNNVRLVLADHPQWLTEIRGAIKYPALIIDGPATLRVVVRDQPAKTIVHVLNLDIRRISSFEDKVNPAQKVRLTIRVPREKVKSVRAVATADEALPPAIPFQIQSDTPGESIVQIDLPAIRIATMLVIE